MHLRLDEVQAHGCVGQATSDKPGSKNKSGKGSSSKPAEADAKKEEEEAQQALKAVADAEAAEDHEDRTPVMNRLSKRIKGAEDAKTAEVMNGATVEELKRKLQQKKQEQAKEEITAITIEALLISVVVKTLYNNCELSKETQ